jgi:hypothetical protein
VYEALEQREHQANCGRDRACDGWEAERSRIFGGLGAALARLAGGAIDGDRNGGCALAAVEAGEHAVGGGISGDLEEPVELVSLLVAERCIAEDALALSIMRTNGSSSSGSITRPPRRRAERKLSWTPAGWSRSARTMRA